MEGEKPQPNPDAPAGNDLGNWDLNRDQLAEQRKRAQQLSNRQTLPDEVKNADIDIPLPTAGQMAGTEPIATRSPVDAAFGRRNK